LKLVTKLKTIHIVSFQIPYPADYGGVIDVFFKIKSFVNEGVKVILHTYQYGRQASDVLEDLCEKVYYYKRSIFRFPLTTNALPYIVSSRNTTQLIDNLIEDNYPILFEGLHCCYYLNDDRLKNRFKIVRTHNIEHLYYLSLGKVEKSFYKRVFFNKEAIRLKKFEEELHNADLISAISPEDYKYFNNKYGNAYYLPVFHGNYPVNIKYQQNKSHFCLYHGNLGVGENHQAAMYLVNEVFDNLDFKLIIAGNNPKKELIEAVNQNPNVELRINITTKQINELIAVAQINVLPTFQGTGMKLKLINVLYQAGFVIVNQKMVHKTGIESECIISDSPKGMKEAIRIYMNEVFNLYDFEKRIQKLENLFGNIPNIQNFIVKISKNIQFEIRPQNSEV